MRRAAISRRRWLACSTAISATAVLAAPGRAQPLVNDRIQIGMIGVGDRGSFLMRWIAKVADRCPATVTAVCDVWRVNLERAANRAAQLFGSRPAMTTRFEELLASERVDAVVIATPDFAHAAITIAALRAGKDVYVEKPLAIDIDEANELLDTAQQTDRIVQVGTQYRSHGGYRAAADVIRSGALGQINRIVAQANFNQPRWARPFADCKEKDVDWAAYLFNRPRCPFDPRLLRRWHLYRLCTNGPAGLWMSHYADAVHLLTGAAYPDTAVAHGGVYVWHDGREHPDTFHALLQYPEGFLFSWGFGLGNRAGTGFSVHGTEATLVLGDAYMTPNRLELIPERSKADRRTLQAAGSDDHMANWLECVRSRKRPNADVLYGYQHAVATILAARAYEAGRRMRYDPVSRKIQPA